MLKKLAIIAIAGVCLGAVAIFAPRFIQARHTSASNPCVNNLRQMDGAKQQWMLEFRKDTNAVPTIDDIKPYIKLTSSGEVPPCPQGGTYILGRVADPPRCSIGGQSHSLP